MDAWFTGPYDQSRHDWHKARHHGPGLRSRAFKTLNFPTTRMRWQQHCVMAVILATATVTVTVNGETARLTVKVAGEGR